MSDDPDLRAFDVLESTVPGDETLAHWRARHHPPRRRSRCRRWWRAIVRGRSR